MDSLVLITLFICALLFAYLSLEVKDRMYTVILLLISTLLFGVIIIYSQAYIIGLFYLLVYSGLLSVLFASVSNFIETSEQEDSQNIASVDKEEV